MANPIKDLIESTINSLDGMFTSESILGETVTTPDGTVELPQKEFMLLFQLLSYKDKIFTRRQLMDEIWDMDSETDERTVDVHINRLREHFRDSEDFEIN